MSSMNVREILAFDPGPHTGVARLRDGVLLSSETLTLTGSTAGAFAEICGRLKTLCELPAPHPPFIVIENYHTVGPMSREGMLTIRLMGWLEGVAACGGYTYRFQMPSAKKAWLTEATRLLRGRAASRHERDAVAHGLACLYGLTARTGEPH